ncbi:hypothetical protein PS2_033969 [Malus domestica]
METVKSDSEANKLTMVGKVDPTKLWDKIVANNTKKKVDLISPNPKMTPIKTTAAAMPRKSNWRNRMMTKNPKRCVMRTAALLPVNAFQ